MTPGLEFKLTVGGAEANAILPGETKLDTFGGLDIFGSRGEDGEDGSFAVKASSLDGG